MMFIFDKLLDGLKWLSTYGFIDILFGIGIFAFIPRILKGKTKRIKDIALIAHIDDNGLFTIAFKNQSHEPLYLTQANIILGCYGEEIVDTTIRSRLKKALFLRWSKNPHIKVVGEHQTTDGLYILQLIDTYQEYSPSLSIEPLHSGRFGLSLEVESLRNLENPNNLFNNKEFGLLTVKFYHGTKSGELEIQL